jgi:hypothetical protein
MDRTETASTYVGAANICNAGTANADPIIVCGRLNLHNTENDDVAFDRREEDADEEEDSSGIVTPPPPALVLLGVGV